MKITFLHTSSSHIKRFDEIVSSLDPKIKTEHHVNQKLLEVAQNKGQIDREGFEKEIAKIKRNKNEYIICTCSTYGSLCNPNENVFRIDQPIGQYLVKKYSTIGIAYTASTTKAVSLQLINRLAKEIQKPINIFEIDCHHCWSWFEKGELKKYEFEIASQIKKQVSDCDVIFLAQASMEGAKKHLTNEKYEVVSSPEFGIKNYLKYIKNKTLLK